MQKYLHFSLIFKQLTLLTWIIWWWWGWWQLASFFKNLINSFGCSYGCYEFLVFPPPIWLLLWWLWLKSQQGRTHTFVFWYKCISQLCSEYYFRTIKYKILSALWSSFFQRKRIIPTKLILNMDVWTPVGGNLAAYLLTGTLQPISAYLQAQDICSNQNLMANWWEISQEPALDPLLGKFHYAADKVGGGVEIRSRFSADCRDQLDFYALPDWNIWCIPVLMWCSKLGKGMWSPDDAHSFSPRPKLSAAPKVEYLVEEKRTVLVL